MENELERLRLDNNPLLHKPKDTHFAFRFSAKYLSQPLQLCIIRYMNAEALVNLAWLALVVSLPTQNSTVRMRLWRAVKAGGCSVLRDGVYLLPFSEAGDALLSGLAKDVLSGGGNAHLLAVATRDDAQEWGFRALFDRSGQYDGLMEEISQALANLTDQETVAFRKVLKALRRDFEAISAIDFFPGAAKEKTQAALTELEKTATARFSPGEPCAVLHEITLLDSAQYQGRQWATRKRMWVDRMASAWLIRSFIDRAARFTWLESPEDCPPDALGFDFDGAMFTHVGEKVTFEVLLASFGLESDAALVKLAALVHFLDAGGIPVAEAAGVETVLAGARNRCADDDTLLNEVSKVFDFLYAGFFRG